MQSAMVRLMCDARSRAAPQAPRTSGRHRPAPRPVPPAAGPRSLPRPVVSARSWRSRATRTRCRRCRRLVTQDRTRSGRVRPPGPRTRRPSRARRDRPGHLGARACHEPSGVLVHGRPKPAGRALSKPGSDSATVSGRSSAASRPCQTAGVSGTPWTKTAVMPVILPRPRIGLTRQLNVSNAVRPQMRRGGSRHIRQMAARGLGPVVRR